MEFNLFAPVLLFSLISQFIHCSGEKSGITGSNSALLYLSRYGYIDPMVTNSASGAMLSEEFLISAVKEFQAFANLNQTGILDEFTIKMMNTPRCGVKDKVGYGSNARKKRYALQGSRWKVRDLTYKITKYPQGLTKDQVNTDIDKAFNVWEGVTDLTFKRVRSGKIHIEIRFETREHGDGDPFDGPGGTLAHAYFPIYGGDAHFDDSETWTVNRYSGTNLFKVAAHEFGHSLGLSHSDVESSLMAPFYTRYTKNFKLHIDDITAIQSLYGAKEPRSKGATTPKPSVSTRTQDSALCTGNIDTIVTMQDKETYVFKGSKYWKLTDDGVALGYPKSISTSFKGLPSDLDAAFTYTNGKTYFFKGNKYWRSSGFSVDLGYPKAISKGFVGIPSNIDTAFIWSGNGKIYFFKGNHYWKFDADKRPPVAARYPKIIDLWKGLKPDMNAALKYKNDFTYFFKDGSYWRFNDREFEVDKADPGFPRNSGVWWFGCPDKGSQVAQSHDQKSVNNYYDSFEDGSSNDVFWRHYGIHRSSGGK